MKNYSSFPSLNQFSTDEERLFEGYVQWCKDNAEEIAACLNTDIDRRLLDEMKHMRRRMFEEVAEKLERGTWNT